MSKLMVEQVVEALIKYNLTEENTIGELLEPLRREKNLDATCTHCGELIPMEEWYQHGCKGNT